MRRCIADPMPVRMWEHFVEQQQNLMRSIQKETTPAAPNDVTETSCIKEQDQLRLIKIIDERPDLIMKGPLDQMEDERQCNGEGAQNIERRKQAHAVRPPITRALHERQLLNWSKGGIRLL